MTQIPDSHGHAALMLCESLMLLLVEEGVVHKDLVVGAVENVVSISQEMAGISDGVVSATSVGLLRGIVSSLLALPPSLADGIAHDRPPS